MTAPALAALMWKLMTNPNFGILSYLVSLIGFSDFKWASDPSTALFTVVLVDIWVYTPFIMILLLAGLRSLPKQPFEAAALDGVPRSFVFFRITLPMLMPYIITATLFRLLDSIQQFDIIYAMTQGGPGDTLMVFQVAGLSRILPVHQCRAIGGAADHPVGDHLFPVQHLHQALAEAARAHARRRLRSGHGTHLDHSNGSSAASLITLVLVFFLFPIFWILLMSFQTNETILRIPPSLFFEPTLPTTRR